MRYAELHCRTNFTFLEAASSPEEMVARAAALQYAAIAITDIHSVAGMARAYIASKNTSSKLIVGAEIRPNDAMPVVLWAKDRKGYGNLCSLITAGRRRVPKGQCSLQLEDVAQHSDGLIAGIVPNMSLEEFSQQDASAYKDIFVHSLYLLAEFHLGPHDKYRKQWLEEISRQSGIPLVAAGNVLFHVPERKPLLDVLTAIRLGKPVDQVIEFLQPNAERHLRPFGNIETIYAGMPEAIERTIEIADQCVFKLGDLKYEYPEEVVPAGLTPQQYLRQLVRDGSHRRYPAGVPKNIQMQIERELVLIKELEYEPYFLTVYDLIKFAETKKILCQGRGAAANSVVCYCLGITAVDPTKIDLLFERFVSRERKEAPDIDVDFEHERREEVLQYIYQKYGRERAGITAVTVTYRPRSAIRDVGKALGFSLDLVDRLAKNASYFSIEEDFKARCKEVGLDVDSPGGRQFVYFVNQIVTFPRHLSQHTGGMIISRGPLHELVPIENAAMGGRTVVQWNKDDLDDLGILKVDCLALGMLTAIRKCFDFLNAARDEELTLQNVPREDSAVYDMICKADTMGVFQIESRAQMSMLPRLRPRNYYDLVIEVAIVRPGPIQGQMVHPYLRRRNKEEEEVYPNDAVRSVLSKTLGVPLFQEQCMKLAIVAAGFTADEADQLRRAMAAWRRPGLIGDFEVKLINGMMKNGLDREFAERVFTQIRGFGEYGFPESHAASFALLVYVSCWLKHYHVREFVAAIINSQPMGFYAPAQLIQLARRNGVKVLPVDVNYSDWDCTLEADALRLGFRLVRGMQKGAAETIVECRRHAMFTSMHDFETRTAISQSQSELLAEADAFSQFHASRRSAMWEAMAMHTLPRQRMLFETDLVDELAPDLPAMLAEEEVKTDYNSTGLSLRAHPLSFHRDFLNELGVISAEQVATTENNTKVKVAGIVLIRQRPGTAKGITFVTIEDETGTINLIFHPNTWKRFRKIALHSQTWIVRGKLESHESVIHVIAERLEDLSGLLANLRLSSRDFH
jgi:error-prone DNA polymerase